MLLLIFIGAHAGTLFKEGGKIGKIIESHSGSHLADIFLPLRQQGFRTLHFPVVDIGLKETARFRFK